MTKLTPLRAFLLASLIAPGPTAAQQINTTVAVPDEWPSMLFGVGTATKAGTTGPISYTGFGQTFAVPTTATFLTDFSFFIADSNGPDLYGYRAFLAAWDGGVTSLLWQSDEVNSPSTPEVASPSSLSDYQQTTFSVNSAVTPGATYLAYLFPTNPGTLPLDGSDADHFATRTATDATGLVRLTATTTLETAPDPEVYSAFARRSAAFIANFESPVSVPEPATALLTVTGLLGLAFSARTRRRERQRPT